MRTQGQNEADAARDTRASVDSKKEVLSTSTARNLYRNSSILNWPCATPNADANRGFPIPQIQGIIPGMRHALHGNAASPSVPHLLQSSHDVASTIPTTLVTSTLLSPRHSKYPRISPPGFLYPEAIIPYTVMSAQNSNPLQRPDSVPPSESPYHSSIMGRLDYELAYLPVGYKLLFLGTLAILLLGVVWILMVWVVNARLVRGTKEIQGKKKEKNRAENGERERSPIDKASKYAHRHSSESEIRDEAGTGVDINSDSAVTSAAQLPFSYLGNNTRGHVGGNFEMKYRPQHKTPQPHGLRSRPLPAEARDGTFTPPHRVSSSRSAGSRSTRPRAPTHPVPRSPPTPCTTPSPVNPFLDPPLSSLLQPGTGAAQLVNRTSLEWKTGRAAFFLPETPTSTSVSRPVSLALTYANKHSSEAFELDVEALEAGTAPLTGRKHTQCESNSSSPRSGFIRKSKSWIDEGVGYVDGAVTAFATKIGRWTDDDGGDDGSLLPVARQGRGRGISVG